MSAVRVKPSGYTLGGKWLRFNHKANSWQRMGSFGWYNVSVAIARVLRDQGFQIWGEE